MISLLRIDDRLLHGQVAYGWTSSLGANVILIVNDDAKSDPVKVMTMNMAKPPNVKLYIRGIEESGEIVQKFSESQKSNVLVVVKDIKDAYQLIQASGGVIESVNVGGLRYEEGKRKLTDLIAVDEQDIAILKNLQQMGVSLDFRMLPRDRQRDLESLLS